MPINFTVQYDDATNDQDDLAGDIGTAPGIGEVRFVPMFADGARVTAGGFSPRPTGFALRTFTGWLDADGRLKNLAGGTPGMRVWANDPAWGLPRLQYRVEANLTDLVGRVVPWHPFYVDAPSTDTTMYLALEMPHAGQKFGRGRPGFGLAADGGVDVDGFGNLVFTREDGVSLGIVGVPELSTTLDESNTEAIAYVMTFGR